MHDSCHARLLGDDLWKMCAPCCIAWGAETTEARYKREEG
jgi:hypothetical protein